MGSRSDQASMQVKIYLKLKINKETLEEDQNNNTRISFGLNKQEKQIRKALQR
jgi:hypothetical protein